MSLIFNPRFVIFFAAYLLLWFCTANNALFWDTVQFAGDHPNWYYDNNFRYFLLPDYCDSGHPPTFGIYLAAVWKFFYKSLWISHAAMLPFIAMLVFQAVRLGRLVFPTNSRLSFFCTFIILSEGVLLAQCSLVSPDIVLMAFFLFALNAILGRRRLQFTLAIAVMGLLSMRAMMCSFALYLFALIYNYRAEINDGRRWFEFLIRQVLPFIPGAVLGISYFAYHYYIKGWIGYNPESTWAAGFQHVPVSGVIKNFFVLLWRIVDIGKLLTVLVFGFLALRVLMARRILAGMPVLYKALLALWLSLFLITALPLILYQGLLTHRYLLPFYTLTAICALILTDFFALKNRNFIAVLMILCQLSGHFWTYPRRFSQGWDATLAHLPYYDLRASFRSFMEQQNIRKDEVATEFPMMSPDYSVDLTGTKENYKDFNADSTRYIWYSNVSNAMNKSATLFFKNYHILKYEKRGNVEMVLFERK